MTRSRPAGSTAYGWASATSVTTPSSPRSSRCANSTPTCCGRRPWVWHDGYRMTAIEELGRYVAGSTATSGAARELVELHLTDTVGAWIASAATDEGRSLLAFRAAMRAGGQSELGLDLSTRCALARLSEIDDIHLPSM